MPDAKQPFKAVTLVQEPAVTMLPSIALARLRACLRSQLSRDDLGLEFRVYAVRWAHDAGTA